MLEARFLRLLICMFVLLCALPVLGASRDKAANKKIDQAINEDYLATKFDDAESTLLGVVEACEDKCSEGVLAKAWMYVGIVRGAGRNDAAGALEAFRTAFGHDPKVKLDEQLTTPEVKKAFEKARKNPKKGGASEPAEEPEAEEEEKPPPKKKKAEPVEEKEPAPEPKPKKAKKEPAPEPAEETSEVPGGDVPIDEAAAAPEEAPKAEAAPKPAEKEEGSCEKDGDCPDGNACHRGTCEERNCTTDAECGAGSCDEGRCRLRHWVGIHVAQDLSIGGGTACALEGAYSCYLSGTEDPYFGYPFGDGVAAPGFAVATQRILLSYDLAVSKNLTIGLRAGLAIGGGPPSIDGTAFLPVHAEARGSYFFGSNPLASKGFRPYVFVGGGMAQVDAKSAVVVQECDGFRDRDACVAGDRQVLTEFEIDALPQVQIDAYKKLGQGFISVGGGAQLPLTGSLLLQGNLGVMFMLPTFGVVLEPSLGFALAL